MRNECLRYQGPFVYLDGIILRATRHISIVESTHRSTAKSGKTTYSLRKLFELWLNMFTSFSITPLRVIFLFGCITGFIGLVSTCSLVVFYVLDPNYAPRGWTTNLILIVVFGAFQFLALGVIGEYIGRILLMLNRKPQYVVKEQDEHST